MSIRPPRGSTVWSLGAAILFAAVAHAAEDPEAQALAQEVGTKGWLVFSAKTPKGDFDLFIAHPDGSGLRNITNNPLFDDYGGRFSADGKRLLFRCLKKGAPVDHVDWGHVGTLVIANADGSNPTALGKEDEYPWATWSPDGSRIASLHRREGKIRIVDVETRKLLREIPNQGIFRQMSWASDGQRFCGTANIEGSDWNITVLEIDAGKLTQVSRGMNCTPDCFQADPLRVVYSHGISQDNDDGWVMLMQAAADGKSRNLIYAERKQHVYFGCTSPDDQYVVFSRRPHNAGPKEGPMAIVRLADTPMIGPEPYPQAESKFPNARRGPVFHLKGLPDGFEPHWTYADIGGSSGNK